MTRRRATEDPTVVEVGEVVPFRGSPPCWSTPPTAEADVVAAAGTRSRRAPRTPRRWSSGCLDHELGWYAAQEIGELLAADQRI